MDHSRFSSFFYVFFFDHRALVVFDSRIRIAAVSSHADRATEVVVEVAVEVTLGLTYPESRLARRDAAIVFHTDR